MTNSCWAGHFDLIQLLLQAFAIGRVPQLGDDSLGTKAASMAQNECAVLVEMAAVAQYTLHPWRALFQKRLARFQRQAGQAVTVKMEEIEEVESEAVVSPRAKIGLKGGKVGCAAARLDHEFAIDERRANRQGREGGNQGPAEFSCPVQPAAGQELQVGGLNAGLQPVAIEFDLVQPALAG